MFLISLVLAVAALTGEEVVHIRNQPIVGWRGFALSLAYFPILTLVFTLLCSWIFYLDRTLFPACKRGILGLLRRN